MIAAALGACGGEADAPAGSRAGAASRRGAAVAAPAGATTHAGPTAAASAALVTPVESLLAAPLQARWENPGGLRWRLRLDAAVSAIRWSLLGGLIVSVGESVQNVTSRGVDRWARVAGAGHRVFRIADQEILWSPEFGKLAALRAQGALGWTRPWSAEVVGEELGEPLLVDAATVAAVGADGADRWRVALAGLRRISGPHPCDEGVLFQGSRGLKGVAVTISARGVVLRETELERGALVVGASAACEPLVWNGTEIGLLDARGAYRWRREYGALPAVARDSRGFVLGDTAADRPIRVEAIAADGRALWSEELPISGRSARFGVIEDALDGALVAGLCLNIESACSKLDGDRGPFNTVVRLGAGAPPGVLERQAQGHVGIARLAAGGLALASAAEEGSTELTLRDRSGAVRAVVTLPGRLSAGPFVGPDGEVYVATCAGWACGPPYSLFAVTGIAPPPTEAPQERS